MQETVITWGVTALLLLVALLLSWPMLRRTFARWRMERDIASSGVAQLRDVLLDDGMGGLAYYEWLLLTPSAIRVLSTSGRSGIIFAGERMDAWAQVVGKRTTRFDNPLYNLEEAMSTLRYHLPTVTVEGNILFVGDCTFPKGRPEKVLTPAELAGERDHRGEQAVQPVLQQGWEKLAQLVRKVNPDTEGYLLPVRTRPAYWRWALVLLLLAAAGAWLYWRLVPLA